MRRGRLNSTARPRPSAEKRGPRPGAGCRVFVRGLVIDMMIGVHPAEREIPQPVRITIEATPVVGLSCSPAQLTAAAGAVVGRGHIRLVETLAEDVAAQILDDGTVQSVRVRIEKPAAIAEAASVGVEIERHASS